MLAGLGRLADRLLEVAAVVLAARHAGGGGRWAWSSALVDNPLAWSDELAQYLLVWIGFVGWIIAGSRAQPHPHPRAARPAAAAGRARVAEIAIQLAIVASSASCCCAQSVGLIARNIDVEWVSLPLPVGAGLRADPDRRRSPSSRRRSVEIAERSAASRSRRRTGGPAL